MVRVVISHRSGIVRDVIRMLGVGRDIVVVGEASDPVELADLCRTELPDVVVAEGDYEEGGIELALPHVIASATAVIVVCDDPSVERLAAILAAGVSGWLRHDAGPMEVLEAIETVAGGAAVLDPRATRVVVDQWRRLLDQMRLPAPGSQLDARGIMVLAGMADELTTGAIAQRLGVTSTAVEKEIQRIIGRLGVANESDALSAAVTHGFLPGYPRDAASGE